MLPLLAALNLAVSYGTSGGMMAGNSLSNTEVLSLRAGWSNGTLEVYLRGDLAALSHDCTTRPGSYFFANCVSSEVVTAGVRAVILTFGEGTVGAAGELGGGRARGSVTTSFDRGLSVSGTAIVTGGTADLRIPVGAGADVRFEMGGNCWLMSPLLVQYRISAALGAAF
jgi:hypothetical protein